MDGFTASPATRHRIATSPARLDDVPHATLHPGIHGRMHGVPRNTSPACDEPPSEPQRRTRSATICEVCAASAGVAVGFAWGGGGAGEGEAHVADEGQGAQGADQLRRGADAEAAV